MSDEQTYREFIRIFDSVKTTNVYPRDCKQPFAYGVQSYHGYPFYWEFKHYNECGCAYRLATYYGA